MKPHRLKLTHHLVLGYGLYRKLEVFVRGTVRRRARARLRRRQILLLRCTAAARRSRTRRRARS